MRNLTAVAVLTCVLLAGCSESNDGPRAAGNDEPIASATATSTPIPPTATTIPTNTPTPTSTPVPIVPIDLSGQGDNATLPVALANGVWVVTSSYTGGSNFIVYAYKQSGAKELVANTIGTSTSSRVLFGPETYRFDVQASGPWTIHLETIKAELEAARSKSGRGDQVSGIFKPSATGPQTFRFTHTGRSNFIVTLQCDNGSPLAQNVVGATDNTRIVGIPAGASVCFWEIDADGDWTITAQ